MTFEVIIISKEENVGGPKWPQNTCGGSQRWKKDIFNNAKSEFSEGRFNI